MMRFGNHDSPVLLEALGDLLSYTNTIEGAQRLAARAYLKASYEVDDPAASGAYRDKAEFALTEQLGVSLDEIERKLNAEIAEADKYYSKIQSDEKAWIVSRKDVDAEFVRMYYESPALVTSKADTIAPRSPEDLIKQALLIGLIVLVCGFILLVTALVYLYRRRSSTRGVSS